MSLITKDQVKVDLAIPAGTQFDEALDDYIAEAGEWVANFCGQPIELSTVTFHFWGNGRTSITSGYHPISNLTAVEVSDSIGDDWTELDLSLCDVVDNSIRYSGGFDPNTEYRAMFSVGYGSSSIPFAVQRVAREIVAVRVRNSALSGVGKSTLGVAQIAETRNGISATTAYANIGSDWQRQLMKYRRRHGG